VPRRASCHIRTALGSENFGNGTTDATSASLLREVAEMIGYIRSVRSDDSSFDVVVAGITSGEDPATDHATVMTFAAAGCTWWLEALMDERGSFEEMRSRIRRGPPRIPVDLV